MTFQGIIKVGIPRTNQSGLKLNIIGTFVYMQYNYRYSWTSLQWPPWGQKKVLIVERWPLFCREVLNKSQCMDFLSAGMKKSGRRRKVDINRGLTLHVYVFHFSRVRLVHWRSPLYGSHNKVHFSWLTVQKQNSNHWVSLSSKHRKICCPGAKRTNGTL